MNRQQNQLPQVAFSILLALSLKPRHGYEIIKQVEEDSRGKVRLGPGALYTSIKQLHQQELIAETTDHTDTRRRYYKLTNKGLRALNEDVEYYENVLELARQRRVIMSEVTYG